MTELVDEEALADSFSQVNIFGDEDLSEKDDQRKKSGIKDNSTKAVVTIHLAIEGDSTKLPKIISRTDLLLALKKIAADASVEDCLLSAEVLWAPEDELATMASVDVYRDYPDLIPLY